MKEKFYLTQMKVGVTQNNLEVNQAGGHITELLKLDKMIGIST